MPRLLLRICIGPDELPDQIDLLVRQHALPRRHLILSHQHRVFEASPVRGLQTPQIESLAGADQLLAMAGEAVVVVDRFAGVNLGLVLRGRRCDASG